MDEPKILNCCSGEDRVNCDDCEKNFCSAHNEGWEVKDGALRCPLCKVLNEQWDRLRAEEKEVN